MQFFLFEILGVLMGYRSHVVASRCWESMDRIHSNCSRRHPGIENWLGRTTAGKLSDRWTWVIP